MNKIYIVFTSFMLFFTVAQVNASSLKYDKATIKKNGIYSITDYFLLLPADAFDKSLGLESTEDRKAALKIAMTGSTVMGDPMIVDEKNGFIHYGISGMGGGNAVAVVMWKTKDNKDIIGVSNESCGMPGCFFGYIKFYTFQNNDWQDITKFIFPGIKDSDFDDNPMFKGENSCELPRIGTDIICYNFEHTREIKFIWDNGIFTKKLVIHKKE